MQWSYPEVRRRLIEAELWPQGRMARLACYLAAMAAVLFALQEFLGLFSSWGEHLGGWVGFLAFIAAVLFFILAFRWVKRRILWRLRNRLIVTYVFIGVIPAVDWLADSGLSLDNGVVCTESLFAADGVVAAGDVARWTHPSTGEMLRVEHWTNAIEQGEYAARRLLGAHPPAGFASLPYFWSDQGDLKLQMLGSSEGHDEVMVLESSAASLVAEYRSEGRLLAVAGINAGPAVMVRRPEIVQAYQQRSLAAIGLT